LSSRKKGMMPIKTLNFGMVVCLLLIAGTIWAQDTQAPDAGTQQPADAQQGGAAPAGGTPQQEDNPPISGLDQPSLEPRMATRSFLIPSAHISESIDSNVTGGTSGGPKWTEVTRALGSLALQKLWNRYDMSITYVGGGDFYSSHGVGPTQVHTLDMDQRLLWRTGQFAVRDSFSYLPEGSFGYGAFGGASALSGIGALPGGTAIGGNLFGFFGPGQFASLGQQPRVTNVSIADVTQYLSPRTSLTAAGSYGLTEFINNNTGFINSRQESAQVGYNYQISRKNQIALVYGYQHFLYPNIPGASFDTHLINGLFSHRITNRMSLTVGAGPQIIQTHASGTQVSSTRVSGSGQASLHYRFPRTNFTLTYDHFTTAGSGLVAGATSDVARLDISRNLGRKWVMTSNVGFTHNTRVAGTAVSPLLGNTKTFDYLYAGGSITRKLTRTLDAVFSYQFNDLLLGTGGCGGTSSCSSQRHMGLIGLDWHPRPIRLD
jgi:hypothetical protein